MSPFSSLESRDSRIPSLPLLRHLHECVFRVLSILADFLSTVIIAHLYWFELFSFFANPFSSESGSVTFLSTEPQAAFYAVFHLSLLVALFAVIPFFWYCLWAFLVPSCYLWERSKLTRLSFLSLSLILFSLIFVYTFLIPLLFSFFLHYQVDHWSLAVKFEPRIDRYLDLLISFFLVFLFLSQLPLGLFFLLSSRLFSPSRGVELRSFLQPVFFLLAACLSPPDLLVQSSLYSLLALSYELILWSGFFFLRVERVGEPAPEGHMTKPSGVES